MTIHSLPVSGPSSGGIPPNSLNNETIILPAGKNSSVEITRQTPLRLSTAVKIAFPDGAVSEAMLRAQQAAGNLEVIRVGGRILVTLDAIYRMLDLCRLPSNPPASSSANATVGPPSTSSSTVDVKSARALAQLTSEKLKKRSPPT